MSKGSSGDVAIRTPDQRLRVFVSSTMGELASERKAVARAITALRLTPVLFELGARPHPPQDVYRAYLAQSDIFIGLYWQRYGWIGPDMAISGLEDEFDMSAGMPRLLYIKAPAPDREPGLAELLDRIRDEASASYRSFATPAELGRLVRDDLATMLSERFAGGSVTQRPGAGPVSVAAHRPRTLPVGTNSLIGRAADIRDVAELLEQREVRLVTLTGPGGIGKTRLAAAVGEHLHQRYASSMVFVALAAVTDPKLVLDAIARTVGGELGAGAPLEILAEWFGDDHWLLILDNLEQVVSAAGDIGELLARCPGVTVLVTSRTALGLAAEREYPVAPLPMPAGPARDWLANPESAPAAALFVDRARAVHPDFSLDKSNIVAVAEICRRLEGLPLAIELAAARTRLLDPATLLVRLTASLDALGTGAVDLPERQRTLRATVEWSVGLLDEGERSLLEAVAVFVDGWTIAAAAQVADLDEDRALELSETLSRHSLIRLDSLGQGPRCAMLETVRAFVTERLTVRPDVAEIQLRHAGYYRELSSEAGRPLRGAADQGEWLALLQVEARNLTAAVTWHLTHDPTPLPRLFRDLWPFWHLRDHQAEARPWIEALEPTADCFDLQARVELEWAAVITANEVGDDAAALSARQRLTPMLAEIDDPFVSALCQLAMAWTAPITEDFDGALRDVSTSLEQLRSQDEPFWTALAAYTASALEIAAGFPDRAVQHLDELRGLAQHYQYDWLNAGYRMELGTLAIIQDRPDEAHDLLHEALDLSLEIRTTRYVTVCLAALARLAFANGAPERAATLAGAAEGLRRRAGMSTWPVHRRGEAELVSRVSQAFGPKQFERAFAEGSELSQREAVALARVDSGTN